MRAAIAMCLVVLVPIASGCSDRSPEGAPGDSVAGASTTTDRPSDTTDPDTTDAAAAGGEASGPAVPSPGCEGEPLTDVVTAFRHDVDVDGGPRWYLLTTPALASDHRPSPLVVALHGLMEGAEIHSMMTELGELGQREGFAVAFPQGSGQPVRWSTDPDTEPNGDLAMIDAMVRQIGSERCIDESRIYASGLSSGALMASLLACERSERFAAVGAVAGVTVTAGCGSSRPVPVIAFHGTADAILPFNGGPGDLSGLTGGGDGSTTTTPAQLDGPGHPTHVADWADRNGCEDNPVDTPIGTEVVHRVYDCPTDAAVELYMVLGGGHAWPASEFSRSISSIVGHTTFDVNASELLWSFFRRFRLPG